MRALRPIGHRSFWVGLGAVAIIATGCAGNPMTSLTGAQQVPPVTTSASAVTDITARTSKCQSPASPNNCPHLMGNVYTYGLSPTAAHVHQGAPGRTAPQS